MSLASPPPRGRLELTWTNKALRLLAHDDGAYEWTDSGDHRVAEVRLLHDAGVLGRVAGSADRAVDNLLVRGDALHGLRALARLPEFARQYLGQVKLVYIDPPFNTRQAFGEHYDDALEHSVWLTMIRDRLVQIRDLLDVNGSAWVHLDDTEVHRARCVLDEVFGPDNFVATFIWERTDIPAMQAGVSVRHDYILVYQRGPGFTPAGFASDGVAEHYDRVDEQGRAYCLRTLRMTGPGSARTDRPTMWFSLPGPNGVPVWPIRSDGSEGRWRWGPDRCARSASELEWQQRPGGGWEPYRRIYADTDVTRPPETIWPYAEVGSNRIAKYEIKALFPALKPFATPKPERLLQRILHIATDPGDVVLDCFLGSGTTAAVAHKMRRRWVGIEWSSETISTFAAPRLTKVTRGEDPGGITKSTGWQGGGGFRVLDVAPSMFEVVGGRVVLAPWATGGALAEAICAQGSWELHDEPPFCGRKGSVRLAVVDGLVTADVALLLAGWLQDGERLVVYGTAVDPGAQLELSSAYRGSRVRRVPQSILADYRRQWRGEAAEWISLTEVEEETTAEDAEAVAAGAER